MRNAFVAALMELAARDERVVLLTADLGYSFLEPFRDRYPSRFFNVGVAENNLVGLATGLAEGGFVPFTYTMAAFALPRAYEVVRNGPVAHQLPVRVVGVGGGFDYGANGATHWALDDIALARALGAIEVLVPGDAAQVREAVFATQRLKGPAYLRLSLEERGELPPAAGASEPGGAPSLKGGEGDVCIVALGPTAFDALAAAAELGEVGLQVGVRIVVNLGSREIAGLLERLPPVRLLVTLENHTVHGGLGSALAEALADAASRLRLMRVGVEDWRFAPGSPAYLRARLGLDGPTLARRIREALQHV